MSLDRSFYLDSIRREGDAFLTAARRAGTPPIPAVPSCPGWTVADLLLHLGHVHRFITYRVRNRIRDFASVTGEDRDAAMALDQQFLHWDAEGAPSDVEIPPELYAWFDDGLSHLLAVLGDVSPGEPVGTWFPPNQTAGFWQRRMAHETAVHRWDAQSAVGEPEPIDEALARDGIDEVFDVRLPLRAEEGGRPGSGESYHFHATDGEGEWLVRFEGNDATVAREHGKAGVAIRGTTSDLLLFLWGRVPAERLEVLGDAALVERYFELMPPD